jgi:hypothetical protein
MARGRNIRKNIYYALIQGGTGGLCELKGTVKKNISAKMAENAKACLSAGNHIVRTYQDSTPRST